MNTGGDRVMAEKITNLTMIPIFARKMLAAGRNAGPRLLYSAWRTGEIDDGALREWILHVWQAAVFPASIGHGLWLDMFEATGSVSDG